MKFKIHKFKNTSFYDRSQDSGQLWREVVDGKGHGASLGCSSCYDSFVGLIIQVFIHSVIIH